MDQITVNNMRGDYRFRLMDDGIYHCITHPYEGTPADLCAIFGIDVPDMTQFLRVKNYECGFRLEFRAYTESIIRIIIADLGL